MQPQRFATVAGWVVGATDQGPKAFAAIVAGMTTIQFRRRLIVILLLCVAVAGALIRHFSTADTTLHDVGTLMLLLWLPVIGQVVNWVFGKLRRKGAPADTDLAVPAGPQQAAPFTPQMLVELTLRPSKLPAQDFAVAQGIYDCALVVGNQGFTARLRVASGETVRRGTPHAVQVEFLKPALALPCFTPGAPFRMLVGEAFIGDGQALRAL